MSSDVESEISLRLEQENMSSLVDLHRHNNSDDEVDSEPTRVVLVPVQPTVLGQAPTLEVDTSGEVDTPTSLPLCMCANFRSAYNKIDNLKNILKNIGPDLMVCSESWERPQCDLNKLLASSHLKAISYCRGRNKPAILPNNKQYPPKTGGGAAIIYNNVRFKVEDADTTVPEGIEAVWAVVTPRQLDSNLQKVKRICVGAIYIAPRSPFKQETIEHIIYTIHSMRARYNNEIFFYIGGDFNRVNVNEVLHSYGALQSVSSVPTRKGATLELILTDLHTFYHPPTNFPPLQVDDNKKGKDSDHGMLVWAPKASN